MDSKMNKADQIREAAHQLAASPATACVLIGFDGFIDEIMRPVDSRSSPTDYVPIRTIAEFGRRISAAAGLSCNIEMVPEQVKLGGNGPIMANNLVEQGFGVVYCGAVGANGVVHPVFSDFAARCRQVITLCAPGRTDAVEFDDGKVMLGKMNTLTEVNWERVQEQVPAARLARTLQEVELVGCVNWTMLPNMNSILEGLGGLLAGGNSRRKMFVDLTDPRKRSREDIADVLTLLSRIEEFADVILGLNENESRQVADVLFGSEGDDLAVRARDIRAKLGLFQVVIHPTRGAAVATAQGEWFAEGPYTRTPKLTTGAGDNFNAGYCNGLLSGLNPLACLLAGVSSSGFYVRRGRSASRSELVDFMHAWAASNGDELP